MRTHEVITKNGSGSIPRIVDTINSFRRRYGSWPSRLLLDKGMADAIQEYHITPAGWDALATKVTIQYNVEGTVIAEDANGNSFEYDSSFIKPKGKKNSAEFWIWGFDIID